MKLSKIFMTVFLGISLLSKAQMASSYVHGKMTDSIVHLFNARQYSDIYNLSSENFKAGITEKELTNLFQNDLYTIYGTILEWRLLKEESDYFTYLLIYQKEKVQLNLAVTEDKKISYLQILPYAAVPMLRRTEYFSDNGKKNFLDSLIDKTVVDYMQSPQNNGLSIGVTVNGQHYFYNYGEIRRDSKIVCSSSTLYEIASVTKSFCGILFAKAVLEGKLKEDDELSKFLPGKYPGLNLNGKNVLLKHLANHTSGLPGIPDNFRDHTDFDSLNPYKNYTKGMLYGYLKMVKLTNEPGIEFSYSNTGMALLGLVLEEVYGKSFEELVQEKICTHNDMQNTKVRLSAEEEKMCAQGYNSQGLATSHWDLGVFNAAGGLRSNTSDMIKFLDYNLKEDDKTTLLSHVPTFTGRLTVSPGWFIKKTKSSNTLIWHNGGTEGFRSFVGFINEKKCSVVVLSNSAMDVDYIAIAILDFLQK